MSNKTNVGAENVAPETLSLTQLMKDAQNRARGFATSVETERLESHEKMENVTLAREFKKVNKYDYVYYLFVTERARIYCFPNLLISIYLTPEMFRKKGSVTFVGTFPMIVENFQYPFD